MEAARDNAVIDEAQGTGYLIKWRLWRNSNVGSPGLAFHDGVHQHEGKGVKASLSEVGIFLLRHHESHQPSSLRLQALS